jgi:hypothetical protein
MEFINYAIKSMIKTSRLRWARQVACVEEEKYIYTFEMESLMERETWKI